MVRRLAAAAAAVAGRPARVHLKADTGLSRGGATAADWPSVLAAALARPRTRAGSSVVGLWSHFASADEPGNPSIGGAAGRVQGGPRGRGEGRRHPPGAAHRQHRGSADVPEARYDLVRIGGGSYGLATLPGGAPPWLRPAMTLRARLAMVKRVPAGSGVSYGHRYTTAARDHSRPGAARLRRRDTAGGHRAAAGVRAGPALADRGDGLHGPARHRLRRRAGGGGG